MTRKRIVATMLVGVLAAVGVTGVSSAAPGPYDQAPSIKLKHSLIRVPFKRTLVIGTQKCGTGNCKTRIRGFAAIRNKAGFKVKFKAPRLASGKSGPIRATLPKKTVRALLNTKNGRGHIRVRATITSSTGASSKSVGKVRFQAKRKKK
jgi:hypothetical protein